VDVVDGKTRSVVVTEGIVWLDVPSFHGLLKAGERWPALEKAAQNPPAPEKEVAIETPLPEKQDKPVVEAEAPAQSAKLTSAPPMKTPSAEENTPAVPEKTAEKEEPGPRFAAAMAAFTSGDDARADQLFAAFVRDFPRDGRAEDATFLRAKARARRGDNAGAAAIAREYLRAFPRGLRRPEMERLAGETK
jgi:TolA-binding protein